MYPVRDTNSGLWGYLAEGNWVIEPQFAFAFQFHHGYAAVDLGDNSNGLIDVGGRRLGLSSICSERQLSRDFTFTGFSDVNSNSADFATVCVIGESGEPEWGLIDTTLRYISLPSATFSTATAVNSFKDYLILIRYMADAGAASAGVFSLRDMELKLPMTYSCIYPSNESIWVVCRRDRFPEKGMAFYDAIRNELISDWYWGAQPFSDAFGIINKDGQSPWYFVDRNLQPAFDRGFDGADKFSQGLAAVSIGDDVGYIDTSGQMRLLLPYEELKPFNRFGWAFANRSQSEWDIDIIDRTGKAHMTKLETGEFWDGDYPYFEVTRGNNKGELEMLLLDMELNAIYSCPAKRYW
jgi:hypothetical protein